MRSDKNIRSDVLEGLSWRSRVRDEDVTVAVQDGVVALAGTVDSYAQRRAAEHAVESVNGVRAVSSDLRVKRPGARERSDAEIAHAVVTALLWNPQVPRKQIMARVSRGWVTLEGEVDWPFEREAAEHAVRYLTAVKGVTSLITVRAREAAADDSCRRG